MSQPPRRSLDSLKKEAKRWLRELHAGDPAARSRFERAIPSPPNAPTLRDVQHALARELGFDGWTGLKQDLVGDPVTAPPTLAQYDLMARALLEAYDSGTPEAMERHYAHTWHRRPWEGMRTYVQLDLGRRPQGPDDRVTITLDDARLLVAREYGFTDWNDLAAFVANVPVGSAVAAHPISVSGYASAQQPFVGPPARVVSRNWNEVLEQLASLGAARLSAGGQMTDALLRVVARHPGITALDLSGSKGLTDEGLRHLARLPGLKHLNLSGTGVSDRGLEVLEELTELESLVVMQTGITDAGMRHLVHCDQLQLLNAMWTRVGDGAIEALAGKESLAHFTSGHGVTDAGLAALRELPVFASWKGGTIGMGLTSYEATPNYLNLRGSFTDRGMEQLRRLDGLFGLNLDARELAVTAAGLAHLVDLPNLGWLACDARDESMPVIASMAKLRFLGCQDSVASDSGWVALGASRSIEYIWGRRCHGLRTDGFTALSKIPSLKALSVSCLNVEDRGIALLPEFPALRELMPMDVPDAGYRHIGRCQELDSLVLMYCRDTTDAAMEHLASLPKLTKYFVSYNLSTDRTPEILAGIASLEEITFDNCPGLTDAGIHHLRRLPRLRKLVVDGQRITAAAGAGFGPQVRVNIN